jgi:hypothetical protein
MKQGYVLRVNFCLATSEDEASVRVESDCLSQLE